MTKTEKILIWTILATLFLILTVRPSYSEDLKNSETITLSKEQLMEIDHDFAAQAEQLHDAISDSHYWFNQFKALKDCVRLAAQQGTPSTVCIGDKSL
jgi:hypothetical protein